MAPAENSAQLENRHCMHFGIHYPRSTAPSIPRLGGRRPGRPASRIHPLQVGGLGPATGSGRILPQACLPAPCHWPPPSGSPPLRPAGRGLTGRSPGPAQPHSPGLRSAQQPAGSREHICLAAAGQLRPGSLRGLRGHFIRAATSRPARGGPHEVQAPRVGTHQVATQRCAPVTYIIRSLLSVVFQPFLKCLTGFKAHPCLTLLHLQPECTTCGGSALQLIVWPCRARCGPILLGRCTAYTATLSTVTAPGDVFASAHAALA
jgi:hypothetical protein